MRFALVQCFDENNFSHYLLTEHMRLFYTALTELNIDVTVLTNQYAKDRINILFSVLRASPDFIENIVKEDVDFVIYQSEILTQRGLNYRVEENKEVTYNGLGTVGLYFYLALLSRARLILEVFPFNQTYLSKYNIQSVLFPVGYHHTLENEVHEKKELDLCFFGSMSDYREKLLRHLQDNDISCSLISLRHNLYRDFILSKTKINLAIPFNNDTMSHISPFRVYTGLYNGCMTLSVDCKSTPSVDGLLEYVPEEQLVPRIKQLLDSGEHHQLQQTFRERFKKRNMTLMMKRLIPQIKKCIQKDTYAGTRFPYTHYAQFTALPSEEIVLPPRPPKNK